MSWKKIRRPDALPRGAANHRDEAARRLVDFYTGGANRGHLGDQLDFLTGRVDRSPTDLITDLGGVKQVAALTGAAERTVRDWRRGRHTPTGEHQAALEREARRATVTALGGVRAVAALTNRSESSVRGWVRKRTAAKGDAVHQLNRYEVRARHTTARRQHNQDPTQPLYLKATGFVRVRTTTPTPEYDAERGVCHEITPDLQAQIEDAIARGEPGRVQQAIEASLTADYAGLGTDLYNGQTLGFYLDRIDNAGMDNSPN